MLAFLAWALACYIYARRLAIRDVRARMRRARAVTVHVTHGRVKQSTRRTITGGKMEKRKTADKRTGQGLGLRPKSMHRQMVVKACAAIDAIVYDSKTPAHQIIVELRDIRAHADKRLIELLAEAVTGEPMRRTRR
jgi:hypothetical protein